MKWAVLAIAPVACGGASMDGGTLVMSGDEPRGQAIESYRVGECHDARGERVPGPNSTVRVTHGTDGQMIVVETRERDSLVVDNLVTRGSDRVFQAVLKPKSGPRTLREYRVPVAGTGPATLTIARSFRTHDEGDGFAAEYPTASMTCTLDPGSQPALTPFPGDGSTAPAD